MGLCYDLSRVAYCCGKVTYLHTPAKAKERSYGSNKLPNLRLVDNHLTYWATSASNLYVQYICLRGCTYNHCIIVPPWICEFQTLSRAEQVSALATKTCMWPFWTPRHSLQHYMMLLLLQSSCSPNYTIIDACAYINWSMIKAFIYSIRVLWGTEIVGKVTNLGWILNISSVTIR